MARAHRPTSLVDLGCLDEHAARFPNAPIRAGLHVVASRANRAGKTPQIVDTSAWPTRGGLFKLLKKLGRALTYGCSVKSKQQLIQWARSQVEELQRGLRWQAGDYGGGYWIAADARTAGNSMARVASALDFLRQFAGVESEWFVRAKIAYESNGDHSSFESGVYAVGEILNSWADQVEKGVVDVPRADAAGLRAMASTDIMSQVRTLVEDRSVHPAAPIMLAGAALEVALRAALDEKQVELSEKPGIAAFGRALRNREFISKQDMKDVEQMAGLRNTAAHGEFNDLSFERAGLMEQQVNLFLRRLEMLFEDAD